MRPPQDIDGGAAAPRLSPDMASFRALVLAFVVSYINSWGQSPSYGEIAAATGSNRTRVKRAVASLEKAGLLHRTPGTRGLSLPDAIDRARQTLIRAGVMPVVAAAVTKPTLLPPPALDYPSPARRGAKGHRKDGNSDDRR